MIDYSPLRHGVHVRVRDFLSGEEGVTIRIEETLPDWLRAIVRWDSGEESYGVHLEVIEESNNPQGGADVR